MNNSNQLYKNTLDDIEADGLYKKERIITTPQSVKIKTNNDDEVLNFCANNYLGLADNPDVINAAKDGSLPTEKDYRIRLNEIVSGGIC